MPKMAYLVRFSSDISIYRFTQVSALSFYSVPPSAWRVQRSSRQAGRSMFSQGFSRRRTPGAVCLEMAPMVKWPTVCLLT